MAIRRFIRLGKDRFLADGDPVVIKGSNFQTPTFPWRLYKVWDEDVIHRCLDLAKDLGCNCLRVQLPAEDDEALERFRKMLQWSNDRGMWIYLFFKWWSRHGHDRERHVSELRWAEKLAWVFSGHPGLLAYDVVNEPDWVSHSAWQWAMAPEEGPHRIDWLRSLVQALHQGDPRRPVSVGMTFSNSWWQPEKARDLLAEVDFVDFHYYHRTYRRRSLAQAIQEVRAQTGKPILVGEFGMSSDEGWECPGEPEHSEAIQAEVYRELVGDIVEAKVLGGIQWSLCAHNDEPRGNGENEYGLIRTDYSLKPAAGVFRDEFAVR